MLLWGEFLRKLLELKLATSNYSLYFPILKEGIPKRISHLCFFLFSPLVKHKLAVKNILWHLKCSRNRAIALVVQSSC